jgi:streptogramin lyase
MRIAALLLRLPAISLAQQIAIGEYAIPTAESGANGIVTGPDGALSFTELDGNKIARIAASNSAWPSRAP